MSRRSGRLQDVHIGSRYSHSWHCGCGCQLTGGQWRVEVEDDAAVRTLPLDYDGSWRSETGWVRPFPQSRWDEIREMVEELWPHG